MISHFDKHVGRRFDRGNWSGPRFFRGHQRSGFFYGHPGHHKFGGQWQQPTAERQAQLRAFLERSRKELSDLI